MNSSLDLQYNCLESVPGWAKSAARLVPFVLWLLAAPTSAQLVPAVDSTDLTVIEAGRLLDGIDGSIQRNVQVLVKGDRIVDVGKSLSVPNHVPRLDLSDHTVLPGLLDMHTHITSDPSGGYSDHELHEWPGYEALVGAKNARTTLLAGFTTIRNVGASHWSSVALRQAIDNRVVPGPRVFAAAHSLGITGGHCDSNGYRPDALEEPGFQVGIANSSTSFRRAVHYQIKYGADLIKFCATGGVLSQGDKVGVQQLTTEEMHSLVEAAHLADKKVAAHAHGLEGIKAAIRAGVNSIEHGSMLDEETIRLMKDNGTYHVPTMMAFEEVKQGAEMGSLTPESSEKALEIYPHYRKSIRMSINGGVRIAFGTDAGVYPHGKNAGEFQLLVDAGMTPIEAVHSATRVAAELLGESDSLGTIEAGKLADIIATRENPLEGTQALEEISFVMKGGVIYKLDGEPLADPSVPGHN